MSDVWGAFDQGEQIGRRLGDRRRNAQAYEQGGLDAVRESAFGRGDLDSGFGVQMRQRQQRQFEDDRLNAGFERLQQFGGFATSALRRAQSLSPEQRGAFLNQPHIRQRFEAFGFTPDQLDQGIAALSNPETADQMFSELMGAFQGNIDWSAVGNQIQGVDQTTGEYVEGGTLPQSASGRMATPEEVAALGIRAGTSVWLEPGRPPRVVQGDRAPRANSYGGSYPDDGYDYLPE